MRKEFTQAIKTHQSVFGIDLHDDAVERLADYYELIQEHNPILHLVGPCTAEEFAVRHILESLVLLEYLPVGAKFADVGAGAGLPSIPCLLVRDNLRAMLIESKEKKSKFLEIAVEKFGLADRASVVNKQFQEVDPSYCQFVTCRALDKFTERLPRLLRWADTRKLLLFGGDNLQECFRQCNIKYVVKLIPLSEKRYLYTVV